MTVSFLLVTDVLIDNWVALLLCPFLSRVILCYLRKDDEIAPLLKYSNENVVETVRSHLHVLKTFRTKYFVIDCYKQLCDRTEVVEVWFSSTIWFVVWIILGNVITEKNLAWNRSLFLVFSRHQTMGHSLMVAKISEERCGCWNLLHMFSIYVQ